MILKNYFLSVVLIVLFIFGVTAQSVIIPSANSSATGLTQSPWRKPFGTNRAYERTAIKYTHAEINTSGQINQIGFFCDTVNNPGFAKTKIYIKEVTDSTFTPSTVVAEQTGATLVYNDSIPASAFVKGQWVMVNLPLPYIYTSTNNLEIIIETNSGGTAGTDAVILAKGFRYSTVNGAREQFWQSTTGSGVIPNGNGTLINGNRHNIQLVFAPVPSCSGVPNAGSTVSNPNTVCGSTPVALTLNGSTTGTGLTYQWISSANGTSWSIINGATNSSYSTPVPSSTYFACIVTCSGLSDTSVSVLVNVNSFYNCYCVTGIGGGCVTQATAIDSVAIGGTSLANGPTGCSTGFYTAYPGSGNTTATLTPGQSYQFYTKYTGNVKSSLWIDYNHNGVFEPTEWTQLCLTSTANTLVTTQVNIPLGVPTGLTGMRIRTRSVNGTNDSTTACVTFGSGETEDYLITIGAPQNCVSPPSAGVSSVNNDTICNGNSVVITLSGFTTGLGSAIQWISSTDGGATWNNISGANNPTLNISPTSNTLYASIVSCNGQSDTSTVSAVTINPFYNCYCVTGIGGGCVTQATAIDSVAIGGTTLANGLTGCSTAFYTAYPPSGNTTATLTQGQTYQFYTQYTGNVKSSLWIDYNHNGVFEPAEWTQLCLTSTPNSIVTSQVNIPLGAQTGLTGMRIRSRSVNGANDSTTSCVTFGTGETEDYLVTIDPAQSCVAPPTAGVASVNFDTICAGNTIVLTLSGFSSGSGTSIQWISSTDGGLTWNNIPGANGPSVNFNPTSNSIFASIVTCSGQSDTSSIANVTVDAFYNCYCVTGIGGGCVNTPGTTIDSVAIDLTTLANGLTGCSTNFYTKYPAVGNTTGDLVWGVTYNLYVLLQGAARCEMWIDYNQNGVFEAIEGTQVCTTSTAGVVNVISFQVPFNVGIGLTGMRIRTRSTAGALDSTSACVTFGSGETEDYIINLTTPLGIKTDISMSQLYVFPNPSNDGIFNWTTNINTKTDLILQVLDLNGKEVYTESFHNLATGNFQRALNLSLFNKGIYFLKLRSSNGVSVRKILIQ